MSNSTAPNFGIKWELVVNTASDAQGNQQQINIFQADYNTEALEIQFEVRQTQRDFWYADIAIFNLNDPTTNTLLTQGMEVKLDAGFMAGPYGTIFQGLLLQPLWERIQGYNYKLTVHCIIGLVETTNNFVSFNVASGITQRQLVANMAANSRRPLQLDNIDGTDTSVQSSRGEVVFGQPALYLEEIASDNVDLNNFWISNQGINIRALLPVTEGQLVPTITYSPTTGLVGTPQQTQDGVELRVLLDPRCTVATQIKLTPDVSINQLPRMQGTFPTILDKDGLYAVAGVTDHGDSRGKTWFSDITAFTYVGSKLALLNPS
jgi:hypothetical protein